MTAGRGQVSGTDYGDFEGFSSDWSATPLVDLQGVVNQMGITPESEPLRPDRHPLDTSAEKQ